MLIERLLGPGVEYAAGQRYVFSKDKKGRAVCNITNRVHAHCFLSVEHYREVPDKDDTDVPVKTTEKKKAADENKPADDDKSKKKTQTNAVSRQLD
ncbi:hypothetical protein [Bartonella apis]|uniref:hypothetical protein n=1 Tax=Bartonella apis TaxID=1686310 RepID=UPI00242E2BD6|nr:hypothetical protein [Bartonella apis]